MSSTKFFFHFFNYRENFHWILLKRRPRCSAIQDGRPPAQLKLIELTWWNIPIKKSKAPNCSPSYFQQSSCFTFSINAKKISARGHLSNQSDSLHKILEDSWKPSIFRESRIIDVACCGPWTWWITASNLFKFHTGRQPALPICIFFQYANHLPVHF